MKATKRHSWTKMQTTRGIIWRENFSNLGLSFKQKNVEKKELWTCLDTKHLKQDVGGNQGIYWNEIVYQSVGQKVQKLSQKGKISIWARSFKETKQNYKISNHSTVEIIWRAQEGSYPKNRAEIRGHWISHILMFCPNFNWRN